MPLPGLIEIVPLNRPVRARLTVPGSKSITNRALILAALGDGETVLRGALWSEDTQVMVAALDRLGFVIKIEPEADEFCNRTITVQGLGGRVPRGGGADKPLELFVGNAGTVARFLAAFVCLGEGLYRLHGAPRMHERPQAALFRALRELGYRVEAQDGNDKLPARILGGGRPVADRGVPRSCTVSIEESSQFASALLLCAGVGGWQVKVVGENAEESPYVRMTTEMVKSFPERGGVFQVEPDASSGSYFWAAGRWEVKPLPGRRWRDNVLSATLRAASRDSVPETEPRLGEAPKGGVGFTMASTVQVVPWPVSGWQMDESFVEVFPGLLWPSPAFEIEGAGLADVLGFKPEGVAAFLARQHPRRPPAAASRRHDLGDSIMTAMVMAPFGTAPVRLTDLGRLRVQECDRVSALRAELTKCGAKVIEEGDTLTVYPSADQLHGAEIETYNDHRMAMCFAILGLKVPGIRIKNPACVKKTFPNFFQKLAAAPPAGLGVRILDAASGRTLGQDELFAD